MTDVSSASGQSSGAKIAAIVLAIVAVLAIIVGVIYLVEPAKSLPSILGTITHPAARATAHRSLRGGTALAVGVIFLVGAWFARRMGKATA